MFSYGGIAPNQPGIIFLELGLRRASLGLSCSVSAYETTSAHLCHSKATGPPIPLLFLLLLPPLSPGPSPSSLFQMQNKHRASLLRHFQAHHHQSSSRIQLRVPRSIRPTGAPVTGPRGVLASADLSLCVTCLRRRKEIWLMLFKLSLSEGRSYRISSLGSKCLHSAVLCACGVFERGLLSPRASESTLWFFKHLCKCVCVYVCVFASMQRSTNIILSAPSQGRRAASSE